MKWVSGCLCQLYSHKYQAERESTFAQITQKYEQKGKPLIVKMKESPDERHK